MTKLQTTTTPLSLRAEFWKRWELTVLTQPYLMHMDKFYMNVVTAHYDMRRENMGLIMSMNFYHLPNTTFYQSEDRNASLHKGAWPVPVMHLCCWACNTFLAFLTRIPHKTCQRLWGAYGEMNPETHDNNGEIKYHNTKQMHEVTATNSNWVLPIGNFQQVKHLQRNANSLKNQTDNLKVHSTLTWFSRKYSTNSSIKYGHAPSES